MLASGKARGELSLEDELKVGEDRLLDLTDILEIVRLLRPEFAPGARNGKKAFDSDTNYALLGAIIERTTQASVAEVFKEMIFDPLGLHDTWVFDHTKRQARPADMYAGSDPVVIPYAM